MRHRSPLSARASHVPIAAVFLVLIGLSIIVEIAGSSALRDFLWELSNNRVLAAAPHPVEYAQAAQKKRIYDSAPIQYKEKVSAPPGSSSRPIFG